MQIFTSLRTSLTYNFILVAALPLLAIGFIALQLLIDSIEHEIADKNSRLAKSLAGEVTRFLEEPLNLLEQIEDVVDHKTLIQSAQINTYLDSVIEHYRFFDIIMLLGHAGRVRHLAPYSEDLLGLDMSGQDFFQVGAERRAPYWSPTFISMQTGHATLTLSLPFKHGMLVGYLNLAILNSVTDKIKSGSHGQAWIADSDGTLIAYPDRALVAQRMNVRHLNVVQQAMQGYEGMSAYLFEGINRLGSAVIVPHTHWIVAVSQPVEDAYAPLKRIRTILLTGTSAAIVFAIIIALSYLKKTLQPLSQLTENSQRIAEGHYDVDPPQKHYHEIDELAHNFQMMIAAVKAREDALKQSEERLSAFMDSAIESFGIYDSKLNLMEINDIGLAWWPEGTKKADVVGRNLTELAPEILETGRYELYMDVITTGRPFSGDSIISHPFLGDVYLDVKAFKVGAGLGMITADITERKQVEEKLKKLTQELQRSNQALQQFAYAASHDLQEPLRMVASYTKLLEKRYKHQLDEKADSYIHYAVDGATRMQNLITDLLDYSRVGTQAKPARKTESQTILNNALANLKAAIQESGALVTHDELPEVSADAAQLARVFQNLIANAIKFRGDAPPRIHVSAESRGHEWLFSVQDNGIGIDPAHQERIFAIFQRLHTRNEYPGTGIGLALCKRIINRHGGKIRVESEPGKGAVFYFTLPKVIVIEH